jgi:hypothetical protein
MVGVVGVVGVKVAAAAAVVAVAAAVKVVRERAQEEEAEGPEGSAHALKVVWISARRYRGRNYSRCWRWEKGAHCAHCSAVRNEEVPPSWWG